MDIKRQRKHRLADLTCDIGVYALCDLDSNPIYIGQSVDGIKQRVQRHLTSARSDVIANRQLDIWEIFEVWAWPVPGRSKPEITELETVLIHQYNDQHPLVNGKIPPPLQKEVEVPEKQVIQVMSDEERQLRANPHQRLPRQIEHLESLFGYILEVKNNQELRRALKVHFNRTKTYYESFMTDSGETEF